MFISNKEGIKFHEYVTSKIIFKICKSKLSANMINKKIKYSISNTIKKHTTSDVPIAVMLSGGIDFQV